MRVLNACGSETSASPHTSEPISFSSSSCCPWMYKKLGCTTRCASRNCSGVGLNNVCTCIRKPLHSAHTKRGGRKFTITTLKREHPPTDLQSAGRAKLRERVRRPQPLRLRPGPRCRHTLLGVLPAQHGEEHAVAPREALDLRHGWLVGASPTAARHEKPLPSKPASRLHGTNKPCATETGSGIPQNPTKSAAKPHESGRATLPGRDFAAESVAAQLESTAGRGRQAADSIRGRRGE